MVSLEKSIVIDSFPIYWNAQLHAWVLVNGSKRIIMGSKINTQVKAQNFSKRIYNASLQGYMF